MRDLSFFLRTAKTLRTRRKKEIKEKGFKIDWELLDKNNNSFFVFCFSLLFLPSSFHPLHPDRVLVGELPDLRYIPYIARYRTFFIITNDIKRRISIKTLKLGDCPSKVFQARNLADASRFATGNYLAAGDRIFQHFRHSHRTRSISTLLPI